VPISEHDIEHSHNDSGLPIKAMKNMKWMWILLAATVCVHAEVTNQIASDVYSWKDARVEKTEAGMRRVLVQGKATDFSAMEIVAVTLEKGKGQAESARADSEEMIVVKDGVLKIAIKGETKTVGQGSVAVVMPGDKCSLSNAAEGETTFYTLRFRSKNAADAERGKKAGGSFIVDWNDVKFEPRPDGKGGTRNFFSRPTVMAKRLDLHSTVLNPGEASHDPHHHRAEELILLIDADVQMYLGPGEKDGKTKKATNGDIIYLVSNEYHAISNIGTKPAMYFAFQFE
jgi:(S)-ureidoglycine aminohydrolase